MPAFPRNMADFLTGLLFAALGLGFVVIARDYHLGTAQQMGPGYFPTVLGILLAVIGVVLTIKGMLVGSGRLEPFAWRLLAIVLASVVLFGLTVRGAGLVPAVILLTAVSLTASDRFRLATAAILAAVLAGFCWLVFTVGLGQPLPAFGPWLLG